MTDARIPIDSFLSPTRFLSFTVTVASLEEVDRSLQTVFSRLRPGRFRRWVAPLQLRDIYDIEPPAGSRHPSKVVIYSPCQSPSGCVFVSNVGDGWVSISMLIAKEHKKFQIKITSTQNGVAYPKNSIKIWDGGRQTRVVMVMRDSSRWEFFAKGELHDFEDPALYNNKIKRTRLDRNIIIGYTKALCWDITDPLFWNTQKDAIYYEEIQGIIVPPH